MNVDTMNTTTDAASTKEWSLLAVKDAKQRLLNRVCATLLYEPRFYASADESQLAIRKEVDEVVSSGDPEFILKLALYTRQDLNIRSTANYLLALAALTPQCRPLLARYFGASTVRPDDMLEIVALTTAFDTSTKPEGRFVVPSALRKVIASRFASFSEYSLAKYQNKGKTAKKKGKENGNAATNGDFQMDMVGAEKPKLPTLKAVARICHLKEPVNHVMALLGKRYPATAEAFAASGLSGTYDSSKAGERMKLSTGTLGTWEQELSKSGNTAATWEALLDGKALGYMALLRNLRNLLQAGISEQHHSRVLARLANETAVAKSRLFPFRFLSAFECLKQLEGTAAPEMWACSSCTFQNSAAMRSCEMCGTGATIHKRARTTTMNGRAQSSKPKANDTPAVAPSAGLLEQYRTALNTAVKLAIQQNVKPIRGKTAVMCDVSGSMMYCKSQTAKGLGSLTTPMDISILCGMLLRSVCQDSDVYVFGSRKTPDDKPVYKLTDADLAPAGGNLLTSVEVVKDLAHQKVAGCNEFFYELFEELMDAHEKEVAEMHGTGADIDPARFPSSHQLERMVLYTDVMIDRLHEEQDGQHIPARFRNGGKYSVDSILAEYRKRANPQFQFIVVDLFGSGKTVMSVEEGDKARHSNNIWITGYSDQVFRFLADRGTQLEYVERIDEEKGL